MAYFRKVKDTVAPKGYMSRLKSITVRIFIRLHREDISDGHSPARWICRYRLGAAPFRDSFFSGRVML